MNGGYVMVDDNLIVCTSSILKVDVTSADSVTITNLTT